MESFKAWKTKFDQEMARKRAVEEEEKLKGLNLKEREEWRKVATRFTGESSTSSARTELGG